MGTGTVDPSHLAGLVDRIFDQVLGDDERAELLEWIREWEAANPDVDAAHRVTGWIDVAYAFQARADAQAASRSPVAVHPPLVAFVQAVH